jgi:hypothetical protein
MAAIGINIRYLFAIGKLYSFWVLFTGVMLAGFGTDHGLGRTGSNLDHCAGGHVAVHDRRFARGPVIGPEDTQLKTPAKSTIVRDKSDCLVIKFRRHKLLWARLFFRADPDRFYWTAIIPLVLAPLGTSVPYSPGHSSPLFRASSSSAHFFIQ